MKFIAFALWACVIAGLAGFGFSGLGGLAAEMLRNSPSVYGAREGGLVAGGCLTLAWLVYRWGVRTQGM